ncbi:DUF6491 family protein [Tsuneonella suprasediminis]|uniref:DUF6491 family protein n=1 Tax=Tsuneonella suprasediminis TaxID=2306996 RepID=UPI002F943D88
MFRRTLLLPFAAISAVGLAGVPAIAQTDGAKPDADAHAVAEQEAKIPFANTTGIRDWRAEGDSTIYFQDRRRQWYKATLFSPAPDLPFATAVGIDTGPMGTLDRFSKIRIRGESYALQSFVKVDGPPPKKADKKEMKGADPADSAH